MMSEHDKQELSMRILLFTSLEGSWNGIRPEAEIFIRISQKGHHVLLASQPKAPYARRFREENISVIDCYPKSKICFGTIGKLRRIIKENKIDIVYATNSKTIPNAAFACIGLPVKLVNYRGTSRGLYRHDPSAYLTHLHPRVDGICCNAEAVRSNVLNHVWKNKDYVRTIYKGHNLDWFSHTKTDLSEFGIPPEAVVVTCVANARPSKGVDVLLKATWFLQDIPDLYLLVVGEGVDDPVYFEKKERSPMASKIILTGFRADAPQIIAASDLYVQPSTSREGMAKTLIEAMAQEIATVGTDVGGTKELIEDNKSGFVVIPGNPEAMADKVRILYKNPEMRRSMGKAGKKRIADYFSVERSVTDHLIFFKEIIKKDD